MSVLQRALCAACAELQGLPNVLLTPHIGGSTEEAQAAIGVEVASSLTRFVNRGTSTGAVNFPQARLRRMRPFHGTPWRAAHPAITCLHACGLRTCKSQGLSEGQFHHTGVVCGHCVSNKATIDHTV